MSYWVDLNCSLCGRPLTVASHTDGGAYATTGTGDAILYITYNYSVFYCEALNSDAGLRLLDGARAAIVTEALRSAVEKLGVERSGDYLESTPGNAGYALSILLKWAEEHPDGVFEVS